MEADQRCNFITLIAATEDEDAINAILSRFDTRTHKRRAAPAGTPRVTAALKGGRKPNEDAAYWVEILTAICDGLALRRVGLMHHFENRPRGRKSPPVQRVDGGEITNAAPVLPKWQTG